MPNLLQFNLSQFIGFAVIFARISGVMITAPVLNDANIPPQVKIAFSFLLSLIFFPLVAKPSVGLNPDLSFIIVTMVKELGIGVLIGFVAQMMFAGIGLGGELVGFQMGLGVANVFDPLTNTQVSLVGQLKTVIALMLFVGMDGHHMFIEALVKSYDLVAPGAGVLRQGGVDAYMSLAAKMFGVGIQIGAPLIVALLAANFAIGLVARAVPQVNVFVVGYPFTIGLGLLLMTLALPFLVESIMVLHHGLEEMILSGLRALR
jgi:flagellar biosynthetic protein FliR